MWPSGAQADGGAEEVPRPIIRPASRIRRQNQYVPFQNVRQAITAGPLPAAASASGAGGEDRQSSLLPRKMFLDKEMDEYRRMGEVEGNATGSIREEPDESGANVDGGAVSEAQGAANADQMPPAEDGEGTLQQTADATNTGSEDVMNSAEANTSEQDQNESPARMKRKAAELNEWGKAAAAALEGQNEADVEGEGDELDEVDELDDEVSGPLTDGFHARMRTIKDENNADRLG